MASQVPPATLSRAQSALTTMLAEDPDKGDFHEVFTAVPRKPGEEPESAPVAELTVPRGCDFCVTAGIWIVIVLVLAYACSTGLGLIISTIDIIGGSCGQETWMMEPEEACTAMLRNSFTVAFDFRCLQEKPSLMKQEDFEKVCGANAFIGPAVGAFFLFLGVANAVYQNVGKAIPSKVSFHPTLFAVESWHGKFFQCSFYADVTSAKLTSMDGLVITTKAKATLNAGGKADDDKTYGKVLKVLGESTITVITGDGKAKNEFLTEFSKYLPVRIDGFNNVAETVGDAQIKSDATFLNGKLKELLRARGGIESDKTEFQFVRKPLSCDLISDFVAVIFVFANIWYGIAVITTLITWAMRKGSGECLDPLRPGVDMCAAWRIFVPLSLPLVTPSDWINLFLFIFGAIGAAMYYFCMMSTEFRFHSNGVVQEVLSAGWSWQDSKMVFAEDVVALELSDGALEKCVKVKTKASYVIKQGLCKPFEIQAVFVEQDMKLGIVNEVWASCSGHGEVAAKYREKMMELVEKFKPGLLAKSGEAASKSSSAEAQAGSDNAPAQEVMREV